MHTSGVMAQVCVAGAAQNNAAVRSAARHVRSWIARYSPDSLFVVQNARWNVLTSVATQAESHGDYELAEAALNQALNETANFSLRDPRVGQTLAQLADLYFRWGNIEQAKKYFYMEATIAHVVFGNYHVNCATTLSRLGTAYFADESYPAAALCFRQALQVHVALSGMDSWASREAAQNLAFVIERHPDFETLDFAPGVQEENFAPEILLEEKEAENIVQQFVSLLNKNVHPGYFKKKCVAIMPVAI